MAQRTTAVIVDDEPHASVALADLLQRRFPYVHLLGTASEVSEGDGHDGPADHRSPS